MCDFYLQVFIIKLIFLKEKKILDSLFFKKKKKVDIFLFQSTLSLLTDRLLLLPAQRIHFSVASYRGMLLMNSSVLCVWNNFKLMIVFWSAILLSKISRLTIFGLFCYSFKDAASALLLLRLQMLPVTSLWQGGLVLFFSLIAS